MVINRSLKYLFISTPKSGTHTMYDVLTKEWGGERYGGYHETTPPQDIELSEYTIFTTIRNPFDRIVSAYNSLINIPEYAEIFVPKVGAKDFDSFVEWVSTLDNDRRLSGKGFDVISVQTARLSHIPNVQYLPRNHIELFFRMLPFVGHDQEFPTLLKREHASWEDLRNDRNEELIREFYKADIEKYRSLFV